MSFMSLVVAILPVILIGLYIYKKDNTKESSNLLFKLFIGGVGSCFPAVVIGLFFNGFLPDTEQMNFIQLFFTAISVFALTGTHIAHNFERRSINRQRPAKARRR